MTKTTQKVIKKAQYEAGKWAMGISNYKVAEEFVHGELGWKTLKHIEALSKLKYYVRLQSLPETRWVRAVATMIDTLNLHVSSYARMKHLYEEFQCANIEIQISVLGVPLLGQFFRDIDRRISTSENSVWIDSIQRKSSLELYRLGLPLTVISKNIYDNSRGSTLLALARAGMLQTRKRTHGYDNRVDPICSRFGMQEETIEHVIFECNDIYASREQLLLNMGLLDDENLYNHVKETKQILMKWEKETRSQADPLNGP